jgi:hypothetical protein
MKINAFQHTFCKRVFSKIDKLVVSQFFQLGAIIGHYYSLCFPGEDILYLYHAVVAGGNEMLKGYFPLITPVANRIPLTGREGKKVQVFILCSVIFLLSVFCHQETYKD